MKGARNDFLGAWGATLLLALFMLGCSSRSKEMKNAETYMQVNELGKAKELLDLEIQTNPKNAEAYVMLAKVFLLGGDPLDARAAFDKALLLDSSTKTEISKTYFEAAQGVVENKGDGASGLVSTYLQEAATLDPDLKGKIADWASKRAKAEASANKTTAPIALLQATAKAAPDSRDRISGTLLDIANAYLEKQFLREAAAYAMEAGQQSASKLSEASSVLRRACTLLPAQDREYARGCLEKAVQWNPALANDDDVSWLTSVGLKADGGSGAADYLAKFPNGKHSGEAASMLMERRNAAEQAAKKPAYLGCYQDNQVRDLPGVPDSTYDGWVDMPDNAACQAFCGARGFRFAGMEAGPQCWCGNSYGKYGQLPESRCDMRCSGKPSESCGGHWANSIYKLGSK
jgi:tetratricopeptide (TPR) repeat protein